MATNYYNKYIKYKFKYLNLVDQSGSAFQNIKVSDKSLTFQKEKSDSVIILDGIKHVILIPSPEKNIYIIVNNTDNDFESNYKKITDASVGVKCSILKFKLFPKSIYITGNNVELLQNIDRDEQLKIVSDTQLIFKTTDSALENYSKMNNFQSGIYKNFHISKNTFDVKYSWNRLKNIKEIQQTQLDNVNREYKKWHIYLRFRELSYILENNIDVYVVLYDNFILMHSLIKLYPNNVIMHSNINSNTEDKSKLDKSKFTGNPGKKLIHVRNSNPTEFNYPYTYSEKRDGIFGIITTEITNENIPNILVMSNYLLNYYPELVYSFYTNIIIGDFYDINDEPIEFY